MNSVKKLHQTKFPIEKSKLFGNNINLYKIFLAVKSDTTPIKSDTTPIQGSIF